MGTLGAKKLFSVEELDAALFHLLFGTYNTYVDEKNKEKGKIGGRYDEVLSGEMFEAEIRPCVDLLEFFLTQDGKKHLAAADHVLCLFSKKSRIEVFSRLSEKECEKISARSLEIKKFISDFQENISEKRSELARLRSMRGSLSQRLIYSSGLVNVLKLKWWQRKKGHGKEKDFELAV